MALDFGPGIAILAGSLSAGAGRGGTTASVKVQVAADAKPGSRTVRVADAPG